MVTGGASGLGAAVARRLASDGAEVAVVDRDGEGATEIAASIGGTAFVVDVADETSSERAMREIVARFPPIRVLVCCAGIQHGARVLRKDGPVGLDWFRSSVEVNLVGTFNWIRLVAWEMSRAEPSSPDAERGVIVTTSSIVAFDGVEGGVAYAAAKAGVAGMTLALARDLARHEIRVASIAPGTFDTPMIATMSGEYADQLRDSVVHPRRFGSPDEFGGLVAAVIANRYLNGEVIRLDGGLRMSPGARPTR